MNEAWKAKPDEPNVADLMLEVEKAIGGGDREAMETWFERAMKANPDDREACWSKLDWLDPKWYGGDSWDAIKAFGKACAATKNWRTGISLLAADVHLRFSSGLGPRERAMYLRQEGVWSDIQPAYDEYLKHYTLDYVERSKYAALCYLSGRYAEAQAQFQILGDNLTTWTTFPFFPLESMKRMRDESARFAAGKPNADAAPAAKQDGGDKP